VLVGREAKILYRPLARSYCYQLRIRIRMSYAVSPALAYGIMLLFRLLGISDAWRSDCSSRQSVSAISTIHRYVDDRVRFSAVAAAFEEEESHEPV
jgi:hypothetical protein